MTRKQAERQEAIEELRKTLKPGDTVYTVLRKVSRTGMSRRIDVYKLEDGEPFYLTGLVAKAIDASFPQQGQGLKVDGCGMDMGFEVVYRLGWALWPKGFDTAGYHKDGREYWRNEPMSYETDGGYALKQRWL